MKKYIFSVLMAAMAAFTFSSCEDVPAPYTTPEKPADPGTTTEGTPSGTGTADDPFNVAGAIKYINDGGSADAEVYVKGKVVSVKSGSYDASYGSLKYYISDDGTSTNQFYVYNGYAGPNRTKFSGEDALKAGDEVVICGKLVTYSGTQEFNTGNYVVTLNGQPMSGTDTPDTPETGKGSESDPYNVAEAIAAIKAGAPTTEVYLSGIISEVTSYNATYKSITYYISDDGKSNAMQVYSGKGLNGADFTSKEDLKVGQKVLIKGIIKAFVKGETTIYEVDKTSSIIKIEDGGSSTPDTGDGMTSTVITNNKQGTVELTSNGYGQQKTDDEASWYTWTYDGVTYKAAKLCISAGTNGQGLQLQGHASTVTSQGFLFNATEFAKEIKTVTLYLSTKATSTYAPSYSLYAAKTANGRDTKVTGTTSNATEGDWKTYTEVYDLSSYNTKFFTLWNNTQGALYIEKIVVTLK